MGICNSSESTQVATATAKLILKDGRMMEFTNPVKVRYVLQKNPMCFVCNSNDMDFNYVVSAISADEELRLGQIYFALPLFWLLQPLKAEDMATLAVKASSVLMQNGGGGGIFRRECVVAGDDVVGDGEGRRKGRNGGSGGGGGRRRKRYAVELTTIEE